jgi:monoamine oxidase
VSDIEFAVIGAGAAGLAAGLTLHKAGRSFTVLEARNRIGGRAFTDHQSLPGIPFDCGGHWLHAAAQNPFTKIADQLGFRYKRNIDWSHRVMLTRGGQADSSMIQDSAAHFQRAEDAILAAGKAGHDVAFSEVIDKASPWHPLIRRAIHQITSHEPEDCSTLDYARYDGEGGDFPVEDGYGALVAAHAAGLPVSLETPVTAIDWSGSGVAIETPRGTVKARAVIIALPVNVLAEAIRFTPALPTALAQAIHDCPMGSAEKIALLLDRPIDGAGHVYGDIVDGPPMVEHPFNLHLNPFGRPLVVSHLGGAVSRDLEAAGARAMEDLAIERMVFAFGAGIRKRILKCLTTHWTSDPWSRGAYSHALPGRANSRLAFQEAVGERLFFAGEHCSRNFFSTIHGAHLSGIEAATRALNQAA